MLTTAISSNQGQANDEVKKEGSEEIKVSCFGVNACKGQSSCHTKINKCAGTNSCKGKGQILLTKKKCLEKKGLLTEK